MKEYVVVAHDEPSIDSIHDDLTDNSGSTTIPTRQVEVADPRELNPRITNYYLTDAEAFALAKDSRVEAVHLQPDPKMIKHFTQVLNATETPRAYNNTPGNFKRNGTNDIYNVNWGLRRTSLLALETTTGTTYNYDVDGTGVDIVIMDDGVQKDHPEFKDNSGTSRVQEIDWYQGAGVSGTMPTGFYNYSTYGDAEHGSHVAAIAAGKTYGYAKNAKIYSLRIFDDTVDGSQSFSPDLAFDLLKLWHIRKPIDPATGTKRPTIVNMSWGYAWYYTGNPYRPAQKVIKSINYRGSLTRYNSPVGTQINNGMVGPMHGFRVPSIDAQINDGQLAGIVYCSAAGNYSHKVDIPGGIDYNNYYTLPFDNIMPANQPTYYHRGSSPRGTIQVSASDVYTIKSGSAYYEQLAYYSERGPGCDVVSPGTNITSATSMSSSFGPFNYMFGTAQDNTYKAVTISGTSMATPQVTGVCALYLSRNPTATPTQVKNWVTTKAKSSQLKTSTTNNDWRNSSALLGGPNKFLYNPYRNGYLDT